MINNIEDVNAALDYVREENKNFPQDFTDKMDADSYNLACQQIEYQLNVLYEKIRLIQDIDEFARKYAELKIEEKENKLRDSMKIIEDAVDLYHDDSSVAVMVPMQDDGSIIRDRDGSVITKMQVKQAGLVMDTNLLNTPTIAYVSSSSTIPCYNSSYENLLRQKPGMATYITSENLKNGLTETVTIDFVQSASVNYLSIESVNAEIKNVRGTLANHAEVPLEVANGYFTPQELIGIKFDLVCKDYVSASYYTDALSYNTSDGLAFYSNLNVHLDDGQTIKQMEKSLLDSEKRYLSTAMNAVYGSWDKYNQDARNRNIKIAEET